MSVTFMSVATDGPSLVTFIMNSIKSSTYAVSVTLWVLFTVRVEYGCTVVSFDEFACFSEVSFDERKTVLLNFPSFVALNVKTRAIFELPSRIPLFPMYLKVMLFPSRLIISQSSE